MIDALVVGAGIGGLTLAYELQQAGMQVMLVDAAERAGGAVATERLEGFLLDSGPNSTLLKPALRCLIEQLGLQEDLLTPEKAAANRYIATRRSDGRLQPSAAPRSLVQAARTPILTGAGKLRIFGEPLVGKSPTADESVASFVTRRFGREVTEMLAAPLLSGIWAANLETLSTRSALPFLWSLEQRYGSVIVGGLRHFAAKRKSSSSRKPRATLASFRGGMEVLPQALARKLKPGTLRLRTSVVGIEPFFGGTAVQLSGSGGGEKIDARRVIFAVPARAAAALLESCAPALAEALAEVPYAPLGVLHLAYPANQVDHPLDGFGVLVPPKFERALLGAIFSSSLFSGRAPQGHHLLTCFCGGASKPDLADVTDDGLVERIIVEVGELIGANSGPQVLSRRFWPASIPNYGLGHFQLQEALREFEADNPSISFLGNWDTGISVADRVEHAATVAARLLAQSGLREAEEPQRERRSAPRQAL